MPADGARVEAGVEDGSPPGLVGAVEVAAMGVEESGVVDVGAVLGVAVNPA